MVWLRAEWEGRGDLSEQEREEEGGQHDAVKNVDWQQHYRCCQQIAG